MVFPIELAAREGWNPGLYDGYNYYNVDPEGFFLAELNGGMAGCIWAVRYSINFGFIGGHVVLPPFRKQGIGEALFKKALEHLNGRLVGIDGLVSGEEFYNMYGFTSEYEIMRFGGIIIVEGEPDFKVTAANDVDLIVLAKYDERMFGILRPAFVKAWVEQPGAESACYVEEGRIRGFSVLRPCRKGYRLGPLFADSPQIARTLICHLACKTGGNPVFIDVPLINNEAVMLVHGLGMKPVLSRLRLYNHQGMKLPLNKIYGFTTLDIG